MTIVRNGLYVLITVSLCTAQDLGDVTGTVLDASTKQPLAAARVIMVRVRDSSVRLATDISSIRTSSETQDPASDVFATPTDEYGAFHFRTTAPARFMIYARHAGYVDWGDGISPSRTIKVEPKGLSEAITISLEPVGAISGRVIDRDTEKPVPGLQVMPMRWYSGEGARALIPAGESASTDADGTYVLKGLEPGEYLLKAVPVSSARFIPPEGDEDFRTRINRSYARSYYPGVNRPEEAAPLTLLRGGNLRAIDFTLARQKVGSLRGRVFAADAEADQAEISLSLTEVEKQGNVSSYRSIAKCKLPNGSTFQVDNLSPGVYWLGATTSGQPAERSWAFAAVEIDGQNVGAIALNLRKGLPLPGTVKMHESLNVPLPNETPLRVLLSPRGRQRYAGERPPVDVSSSDGTFTLQNVLEGSYDVTIRGLPKGLALCEVRYNGVQADRLVLTMNTGALDHRLELVLCSATASITLTASDGTKPAAGAQFVLLQEWGDPQDLQQDAQVVRADTDGRGTFTNLLAGKYRVFAFPATATWRSDQLFARQLYAAKDINVSAGSFHSYDLKLSTPH